MKKQAGFTIVELVVVIALLGILAAVALPRFLNVTDDAHQSAVSGAGGALRSAVALVKSQSVVDGVVSGNIDFGGQTGVYVNAAGYPQGNATLSARACVSVWEDILQTGAPTVSTNGSPDYKVTLATADCVYSYQGSLDGSTAYYSITYTPADGSVVIDTTK